jgi:rhodanese-related sulfurtransferase
MSVTRPTIGAMLEAARARIDRLEPAEALAAQQHGALLIDTRATDTRAGLGVIPGAVHVPLSVLYWRLDPTSESHDPRLSAQDRQVIVFCSHGYSSSLAAATLRDLGFTTAADIVGGFEAWAAAGLPVEVAPHPASALPIEAASLDV